MLYLKNFSFLPKEREEDFFIALKRTCYSTAYPFGLFPQKGLTRLEFEPVTILSGGNGSGKTTALNIMAQALEAKRTSPYNSSAFFEEYVNMCSFELDPRAGEELNAEIITSDDVFDFIFNIRSLNDGIDERREELFAEWLKERSPDAKPLRVRSMDDYAELVQQNKRRRMTQSAYVRASLMNNVRAHSNGEVRRFMIWMHSQCTPCTGRTWRIYARCTNFSCSTGMSSRIMNDKLSSKKQILTAYYSF